jgi:protein-tyrosine kinase
MAEADPVHPPTSSDTLMDRLPIWQPKKAALRASNIVGHLSSDPSSRPFNLMRTRLLKEADERGARLIGVTSSSPASGKSFLALNLAISLARLGERPVYLVDLDLRRGSLASLLGIELGKGVESYLSGEVSQLELCGIRLEGLPLGVFLANAVSTGSAEVLAGERFGDLIATLRERTAGGIVLFDLPPVFANDDAMIALEALDGYLLVADAGRTTVAQVGETIDMLQPSPCLGTILNRYKGGILDTYGYGSSMYNRYYNE